MLRNLVPMDYTGRGHTATKAEISASANTTAQIVTRYTLRHDIAYTMNELYRNTSRETLTQRRRQKNIWT
jgi:hypothetical protein